MVIGLIIVRMGMTPVREVLQPGQGVESNGRSPLTLSVSYVAGFNFLMQAEHPWSGLLQTLHLWMQPWVQGRAHLPVWNTKQICFALAEDNGFEYKVDLFKLGFRLP